MELVLQRSERAQKSKKGSNSISGIKLIAKTLPEVVKLMAQDIIESVRDINSHTPEFYQFLMTEGVLDYVRLEDMANIALSYMFDAVGNGDKLVRLTNLQRDIGEAIEQQATIVQAEQANPKFVEYLSDRYFKLADMTKKKKTQYVKLEIDALDDPRLRIEPWNIERVVGIGSWAIWAVTMCLPWFQTELLKAKGEKFETRYLFLSEEGKQNREQIELAAASKASLLEPMLIPPNNWTLSENTSNGKQAYMGGYLTESPFQKGSAGRVVHGHLIKSDLSPDSSALDFLNRLQQQPWRINTFILDLLQHFSQFNIEIGSYVSYVKKKFEIPSIPNHIMELPDDDERKRQAKRELWAALNKQKRSKNRYLHPQQTIAVAEDCRDLEQFYMPWFYDTRFRAYPLVSKLSPQGTDFHKALLLFADGAEVTDDNWEEVHEVMLIALATTWGNKLDKQSFNARLQWGAEHVAANLDLILADPTSEASMAIWTQAEEPFQHLALLKEYKEIYVDQTSRVCRVPIGYDATCSGLQLLGAFIRDQTTCELVNVLPRENGPDDPPMDAYGAVADKAIAILKDPVRWRAIKGMQELEDHGLPLDKIDRKVAKKVVMLIPYGGTYDTLKGHVGDATKDWGLTIMQVHWLTKALILGMTEAVPGFTALNAWFKAAAKAAMDQGLEYLQWHTKAGMDSPTSFNQVVGQSYRDPMTKQVNCYLVGKTKVRTEKTKKLADKGEYDLKIYEKTEDRIGHANVVFDYGDVLKRKNETAIAANWTHSQDTTVLQLAFKEFNLPFTTVHDCVYAPAPVIRKAVQRIREAFVETTSWDAIQDFIDTNKLDIPPPQRGTADITQALYSDYLFS